MLWVFCGAAWSRIVRAVRLVLREQWSLRSWVWAYYRSRGACRVCMWYFVCALVFVCWVVLWVNLVCFWSCVCMCVGMYFKCVIGVVVDLEWA